jgi:hypothetical protein
VKEKLLPPNLLLMSLSLRSQLKMRLMVVNSRKISMNGRLKTGAKVPIKSLKPRKVSKNVNWANSSLNS